MKLALKFTLALVLGLAAVMAGYDYVEIGREVVILNADLEKNEKIGHGIAAALADIWAREGEARARETLDLIDREGPDAVHVGWHWLDDLRAHPPPLDSPGDVEALGRRNVVTLRRHANGDWFRHLFVPMSVPGGRSAVIEVTVSLNAEHRYLDMTRRDIVIASGIVAVICAVIAMWLGYWFVGRPLARLRDRIRQIGAGDLSARVRLRQRDEIGELAAEFDLMSDRLEATRARLEAETEARIATLDQLRHTDRLTTVGRLAAGVAHDLGTPLNVISNRAGKIVAAERAGGPGLDHARVIQEQAGRMVTVIRQLLDFSRRQGPKLGFVNLHGLVTRTMELLVPFAQKQGVTVQFTAADDREWLARVDQNQIQQALANVVMNGIEAMAPGGYLRVSLDTVHRPAPAARPQSPPATFLRIRVGDEGEGISEQDLPHIFEPFFTTKGVGEGTGLGLSVAHGIVTDHGGWIEVESERGKGTRVSIHVAAAQPARAEAAS
jgi:signal transduction histidine kinase